MDIGKQLRDLREAKRLSLADVAARIGVPKTEISNIEDGNGMPTLPMLQGGQLRSASTCTNCSQLGGNRPKNPHRQKECRLRLRSGRCSNPFGRCRSKTGRC